MDIITSSPPPLPPIAGDSTKTGSVVPSNDTIMRFLSSKAGPCSAKGLLVGALIIGDNVIPLQAAPVAGQGKDISFILDMKSSTPLSVVSDAAPCAADIGDSCSSTKIILSEGSEDDLTSIRVMSDDEDESSMLARRGVKTHTALGLALLTGTAIASAAAIRKVSHMGVIPRRMRHALGLPDDKSPAETDPIVLKVTRKELEELARKQAKKDGDTGSAPASKREEEESPILVKRSFSPIVEQERPAACSTARHCHWQGRNRLSDLVVGTLAVSGLVAGTAASTVDSQMPFGHEQPASASSGLISTPATEPVATSQVWAPSPVRLPWSTEEAASTGDRPLIFVAVRPDQVRAVDFDVDPFVRPQTRRGRRVMRQTIVQEVSDSNDWPAPSPLLEQEVVLDKRGTKVKGSQLTKYAAGAAVVGYIARAWGHPAEEQQYGKRAEDEDFTIEDVDLMKRGANGPKEFSHGKAAAIVGLAGLGGWLVQVNGHEKQASQQVPTGMVRRVAAPIAGSYAEEETTLVRRCDGNDCHRHKAIVSESKHGDQLTLYTKSGDKIVYDKQGGSYNSIHHNIHESLRHKMAQLLHLDSYERMGVHSNSASSKMRAPGMLKLQVFFITLLSFALFASSASASEVPGQARLVKRSPVPVLGGLMQYGAPAPAPFVTGSSLAAAPPYGHSQGVPGVEGFWQGKQVQHRYPPLTDEEMIKVGVDPKTYRPDPETQGKTPTHKKGKGRPRKMMMTSEEESKRLGPGHDHGRVDPGPGQDSLPKTAPETAPPPSETTISPAHYSHGRVGVGPDIGNLGPGTSEGQSPPPSQHPRTSKGPDIRNLGPAAPVGKGNGVGPQRGITFTEGPPMSAPGPEGQHRVAATPSSSEHHSHFGRKEKMAIAGGGAALTTAGVGLGVYACKKGICSGKKGAKEDLTPVFAKEEGSMGRIHDSSTVENAAHQHHGKIEMTHHRKRDLSSVFVLEESTPVSTFHMTCMGKNCNAEIEKTKEPLWEPQTAWPLLVLEAGRSSASASDAPLQARLVKRSPIPVLESLMQQYGAAAPIAPVTGSSLAAAAAHGHHHGAQGVEGLWNGPAVYPNPGSLTDEEILRVGGNPKTFRPHSEEISKLEKGKKSSRKLIQSSEENAAGPQVEFLTGDGHARAPGASRMFNKGELKDLMNTPGHFGKDWQNGIGPSKTIMTGQGPEGAPAPSRMIDRDDLKDLIKAPAHYSHGGMGGGPDIRNLGPGTSDGLAPPPSKHGEKISKGPDITNLGPAANLGKGNGVGPETSITFTEGPPMSTPGPEEQHYTKETSASSHDHHWERKARMGAVGGGVALAVTGAGLGVYACRHGKCGGKKGAKESLLPENARIHDASTMEHTNQHNHGKNVHLEMHKTPHHKRDLSSLFVMEESTPASTFHMTCYGKDCNVEVKQTKKPLWEPQTAWPSMVIDTGRSSALPDSLNKSETFLKKRSPGFEPMSWSAAPAPSHPINSAYVPASGVHFHDHPNVATAENIPKLTGKPELPKPNGVSSYYTPEVKIWIKNSIDSDRSRQGPSSRNQRGRRYGPAPPEAKHESEAKKGEVTLISQQASHQARRTLRQQDGAAPAPGPSGNAVQAGGTDEKLAEIGFNAITGTVIGGSSVGIIGYGVYKGAQKWKQHRERSQESHEGGGSRRSEVHDQHHGTPSPVKRDVSSLFDIAAGRSLFRRAEAPHSLFKASYLVKRGDNSIVPTESTDNNLRKRSPVSGLALQQHAHELAAYHATDVAHAPASAIRYRHYPNFATAEHIPVITEKPRLRKPVGLQRFETPDFDALAKTSKEEESKRQGHRKLLAEKETSISQPPSNKQIKYGRMGDFTDANPFSDTRTRRNPTHATAHAPASSDGTASKSPFNRVADKAAIGISGAGAAALSSFFGWQFYQIHKAIRAQRAQAQNEAQRVHQARQEAGIQMSNRKQVVPVPVKRDLASPKQFESYLKKRSPMFDLAAQGPQAIAPSHISVAHAPATSAVEYREYPNYSSFQNAPMITERPKLKKPVGIQRFEMPDFDRLDRLGKEIAKSRSRKTGPSERKVKQVKDRTINHGHRRLGESTEPKATSEHAPAPSVEPHLPGSPALEYFEAAVAGGFLIGGACVTALCLKNIKKSRDAVFQRQEQEIRQRQGHGIPLAQLAELHRANRPPVKRELDGSDYTQSVLKKRSPMFDLAAQAPAPVASSHISTAHAPAHAGVQYREYPNWATAEHVPVVTEKPKLGKPIGIQRFEEPDFHQLEAKYGKVKSRKIGPNHGKERQLIAGAIVAATGNHHASGAHSAQAPGPVMRYPDNGDAGLAKVGRAIDKMFGAAALGLVAVGSFHAGRYVGKRNQQAQEQRLARARQEQAVQLAQMPARHQEAQLPVKRDVVPDIRSDLRLRKRAPVLDIISHATAPASLHPIATAHAPASPAVEYREYPNYSSAQHAQHAPVITEEPKIGKPIGLQRFDTPDWKRIEAEVKKAKSREMRPADKMKGKMKDGAAQIPSQSEREHRQLFAAAAASASHSFPATHYGRSRAHAPGPSISLVDRKGDKELVKYCQAFIGAVGGSAVCGVAFAFGRDMVNKYKGSKGRELDQAPSSHQVAPAPPVKRELPSFNVADGRSLFELPERETSFPANARRLVKRSPIPNLQNSSEDIIVKRTTSLATTGNSMPTTSPGSVGPAASSLSGTGQVHIPQYNSIVTKADIPHISKEEALELQNKFKPKYNRDRRLGYYGGFYRSDHPDLEEPGPWHGKNVLDVSKGNFGQQVTKLLMWGGIAGGTVGCLKGACKLVDVIDRNAESWKDSTKQALTRARKATVDTTMKGINGIKGAHQALTTAWRRAGKAKDNLVQKAHKHPYQEVSKARLPQDKESSSHSASSTDGASSSRHASSAELPQHLPREPMHKPVGKDHHAIEIEMPRRLRKRGLEEESHRDRCIASGRCSLFDDVTGVDVRLLDDASGSGLSVTIPSMLNSETTGLRKRGLELATTGSATSGSSNGLASAASMLAGPSQVYFPDHSGIVTAADIPKITKPPPAPAMTGETLEVHKMRNPDLYSNRRMLKGGRARISPKPKPQQKRPPPTMTSGCAATGCGGDGDDKHKEKKPRDPDEPGPWHGINALKLTKGKPAQKAAKVFSYFGAFGLMATCIGVACHKRKAINRSIGNFKANILAIGPKTVQEIKRLPERPGQIKQYVSEKAPQAMQAAKAGVAAAGARASQYLISAVTKAENPAAPARQQIEESSPRHPYHREYSLSSSSSSPEHSHPYSTRGKLPHHRDAWERPLKIDGYSRHPLRFTKRYFEDEDHRTSCLSNGRCSLFVEDNSEVKGQTMTVASSQSFIPSSALLPVLPFGFALTIGSIWLSLTLAKSSQTITSSGYQSLLESSKVQELAINASYRPALLLLPLATSLSTVFLGSIYALKQQTAQIRSSSCNFVSYGNTSDDSLDVAMSKRMSRRGRKVMENAALLGISAGAAGAGFLGIKALLGSTPPVEKRGLASGTAPLYPEGTSI